LEGVAVAFVGVEDLLWCFGVVVGVCQGVEVEDGGVFLEGRGGGFEDFDGAVGVGGVEFEEGAVDEGVWEVWGEGLDLFECFSCGGVVAELGLGVA